MGIMNWIEKKRVRWEECEVMERFFKAQLEAFPKDKDRIRKERELWKADWNKRTSER